ncbi:MAG: aldo/keto reductase [Eubacterium sp.]|nr:aldo/keto reductase [Eubacterium sp.]
MKLCLGTVQFGMDYGVFNQPKQEPEYCIRCLDYATQNGIDAIDTATAYGIAEEIVGEFLAKRTVQRDRLFVSTKLLPNSLDECRPSEYVSVICSKLKRSLDVLHTDYVDAYYLHSSRYAFREEILEALTVVEQEGLAKKVGVSVYYPEEAEACFHSPFVKYIQLPYSIFDHRMKEHAVFEKAAAANCSVDVRTVFIKGLIRLTDPEVPAHLEKAKPILKKLDQICSETGFSRIDLAMGYVKREKSVSHLVFGIRTLEQLQEDMISFGKDVPEEIFQEIDREFSGIAADLVVPSLWVK